MIWRRELGFQDESTRDGAQAHARRARSDFEIRYADYHDIGGVMFAYKVDADFPLAQTTQ